MKQKISRTVKISAVRITILGALLVGLSASSIVTPSLAQQQTAEESLRAYCGDQNNFDDSMAVNPDPGVCISQGCDNEGWIWAEGKQAGCESLRGAYLNCKTNPDGAKCNPSGSGNTTTDPTTTENKEECTGPDCCGDVKTSIITSDDICDASDEEGGMIFAILKAVLKFLTAGVGIAAVGGIGYGALLYTTAESKPEQTKKAIGIITNVVIGIVAYALMYVFLNFLIPGGIFS